MFSKKFGKIPKINIPRDFSLGRDYIIIVAYN